MGTMEQTCSPLSYEFIDLSLDAGVPTSDETRRLIRKQAMSRAAAARKERGFWGQHNLRQYPVSSLGLEASTVPEGEGTAPGTEPADSTSRQPGVMQMASAKVLIPASVPSSGYESMRMEYGFDLLDVSGLTTYHSGRLTAQLLSREPLRLVHILRCRQLSYFSFLPSRYGHSACLDDAARCVAARVSQWMKLPSKTPNVGVLSLYAKSLHSLQSALNDSVLCLQPETLCATAILAIYEVKRPPIP